MADPRHLVLPNGIASTGWPAVRDTCAQVGIHFDPWQQDLNRAMLAKDTQGLYAADTVALLVCRQSGKTYDVGAVTFADSIIHPGTTTVWTAHQFKVARESFNQLRGLAITTKMAPHVDPDAITTGTGNECIPFRNGSRIVFAARERGSIRGFSDVRRIVLDEAQILTEDAMSDLAPTMNQAVNPQLIMMGTPPRPKDRSEVFSSIRSDALEGKSEGVLYVEFSADPDCDLDDWAAVAQANPSFPLRTGKRAILRLRKLLTSDDDYAREALGIWGGSGASQVIDPITWSLAADASSMPIDELALGVDVAPDRLTSAVSLAGKRPDGLWHVELDEHRQGTGWVVPWVVDRVSLNRVRAVVLDEASPAASLVGEFRNSGIRVTVTKAADMKVACGLFFDGFAQQTVRHTDQPQVNAALSKARKRPLGDAWAWNRKSADSDITPVVAATLALWGAQSSKVKRPGSGRRDSQRRAVVL